MPSPWPSLLLAALLALPASGGLAQSEEEQARSQLKQLQQDIVRVHRELNSAKSRQDKLQGQLREAELALGKLQRAIADNEQAIAAAQQELAAQEDTASALEASRNAQQARIAAELKAAWQMGQQGQLKVLLNQENPHTVARALAYYRYFFEARNELVAQYRETLRELASVRAQMLATSEQLAGQRASLAQQEEQIQRSQQTRAEAVAQLDASIQSKGGELKQLQQDRQELEQLLEAIEQAVISLQLPENVQAFTAAKGKMPWPVAGKRGNQFGRARNEGKMRWQGINILAKEGTTVGAIHHGRVVYADWFRGSGLLLIIDHGDGYMSLYAHNQSLLREVGEWVTGGTPISTVGSSGGLDQAALYFEIRHNGNPTNPANWCSG